MFDVSREAIPHVSHPAEYRLSECQEIGQSFFLFAREWYEAR
jgi:hypothetical protein